MMKNRNYFKKVIGLWMSLSFSMKHFSFGVINTEWYMTEPVKSPDLWFNDAAFMLSYEGRRESPQSDHLQLSPVLYSLEGKGDEISAISAPCFTGKIVHVPIAYVPVPMEPEEEKEVLICFLSLMGIKRALEEYSYSLKDFFESSNDLEKHNHNMMSLVGNFLDKCNWALLNYSYSPKVAEDIKKGKPVIFRIVIYDKNPENCFNSINVVHNEEYKKLSGNKVKKVICKDLDQAFRPNDSGINGSLFNSEGMGIYKISVIINIFAEPKKDQDAEHDNDIIVKMMNKKNLHPIFKTLLESRETGLCKFYNTLSVERIYEELEKVAIHTVNVIDIMAIEIMEKKSSSVSLGIIKTTKRIVQEYINHLNMQQNWAERYIARKLEKGIGLEDMFPGIHVRRDRETGDSFPDTGEEGNINLQAQDQEITSHLIAKWPVLGEVFMDLSSQLKELFEKLAELQKIAQEEQKEEKKSHTEKSLAKKLQKKKIQEEKQRKDVLSTLTQEQLLENYCELEKYKAKTYSEFIQKHLSQQNKKY